MNNEQELKLQAYLDGELPESEARTVASWLEQDADARALSTELKYTRGALADFEAEIKLPESREFYWSKIQREIERSERPTVAKTADSWFLSLRKLLAPAMGAVAILLAVSLIGPFGSGDGNSEAEVAVTDSSAFTYRDYAGGTTLVWLTYPAENEFTEVEPVDILN